MFQTLLCLGHQGLRWTLRYSWHSGQCSHSGPHSDKTKTNYVHFTTKRNMSVNLQIGYNNNFITNSFYTKFLGLTMNYTLFWNNHIDLLVKKLSKACYIIRNAKSYMSALSLKMTYYAFFHPIMSYGIMFWGNLWHSSIIFRLQKKGNKNYGRLQE